MDKKKTEYAIISNAVDILSVQCAGNREKIIDLLTGYLWDEEEAGGIKKSTGKFDLLDQLESGPWPSFVSDMKKNAAKFHPNCYHCHHQSAIVGCDYRFNDECDGETKYEPRKKTNNLL